jgi:hypothetical protein
MKLNNPVGAPRGSFGMPAEMRESMEKTIDNSRKATEKEEVPPEEKAFSDDWQVQEAEEAPPTPEEQAEATKAANRVDPFAILKELGIEPRPDDFHSLIFKGFVEKTVTIAANPMNGQELTAKLKTATSEEYDLVDELLAEDLDKLKITNTGVDLRRTMWTLAFTVLELNGKPICKPVMDEEKKYSPKETARNRRQILSKLNPFIINKITEVHARMSSAFTILVTNPEYKAVKK